MCRCTGWCFASSHRPNACSNKLSHTSHAHTWHSPDYTSIQPWVHNTCITTCCSHWDRRLWAARATAQARGARCRRTLGYVRGMRWVYTWANPSRTHRVQYVRHGSDACTDTAWETLNSSTEQQEPSNAALRSKLIHQNQRNQ